MGLASPSCLSLLLLSALLAAQSFVAEANNACYGSVGGANGHIYQFDGGVVSTFAARGCQFLLARSSIRAYPFDLFASFDCSKSHHGHQVSRLRELGVRLNGKVFKLLTGRRLSVNGKLVNVPHSERGIRAFYSGGSLVLVSKKFDLWLTYDGSYVGTFRLSARYRGRVFGLAGNCNGRRDKDEAAVHLGKAYKLWRKRGWVRGCQGPARPQGCHGRKERREASKACGRVIRPGRCSNTRVLNPCIIDYCSTRYRPDLRKEVLCANFYLHSRRCAQHHRPLAWRHKSGCQLRCGRHQHFSRKADPCPKTCENHFFGTQRNCFKLPSAEGCRCNRGYVLDGSLCVKPKQCECLAKLCIDRVSHKKCRHWKSLGHCRKYPDVMNKFCRLTCGLCTPQCRNQISTFLCKQLKRRGKCRKQFYRVMCKATCQPRSCGCPPKRRIVSKCAIKFRNKAITTLRWFPDSTGRCIKSVLVRYRACGSCRYRSRIIWHRCNFCKGVQLGTRLLQYREKYGMRRCLRFVHLVSRRCYCPPRGQQKSVSFTECRGNALKVLVTLVYKPANRCRRCVRIRKERVIVRISCRRPYYIGKCDGRRDYVIRRKYEQYAYRCRCLTRLVQRRRVMCRCPIPRSNTVCRGGQYYETRTTSWRLENGSCIRLNSVSRQDVRCDRQPRNWETCQRNGCRALGHTSYFRLQDCSCKQQNLTKLLGKCCCPPGFRRIERVDRYWNNLIIVTYILRQYRCHEVVEVQKIRIACPEGRRYIRCDGREGVKIFVREWFVKRGNLCIKKQEARQERVECRQDVRRQQGNCHLLFGNVRYRWVELNFFERRQGSCDCVPARRHVREMCGCREGKFSRLTKCPRRGCTARNCGRGCRFLKEFFYYKAFGQRCNERVFKRLEFPCCCRPDRRAKEWCRQGRYLMREDSHTELRSRNCHRVSTVTSREVRCKQDSATKRVRHPKPGFYYIDRYRWYVANCKCRVRVRREECRSFCYRPTRSHFCDTVRRQWVTRYVTWKLLGCRSCMRIVNDRRVPVYCDRSVKRWSRCNERTGVVIHYRQWWEQRSCNCKLRTSTKRRRCRCPKPQYGRRRCYPRRNAFQRVVTFWTLTNGVCVRRTRFESNPVKCNRSVRWRSVCNRKTGVKLVYIGVLIPVMCKCVRKWFVRSRFRCNCRPENNRVKWLVKRYCDRRRNLKVTLRFYFVLRRGRCWKRSRKSYRRFRCPRPYRVKRNCDEARRRQLILRHFFVKRNCRCRRLVRRDYRKCGCRGKKLVRLSFCRKVRGIIVRVKITRRWSNRLHLCVTRKVVVSFRVLCRSRTHYTNSKCIKNSYYVEKKSFFVRKGCRCVRKLLKRRRNCHCKNFVRRYKCPRTGFTRREVTEIRRWDMKRRRCRTRRYVTRHIRCRCPKGFQRRYCKAGRWIHEIVKLILRNARCYKEVETRSHLVQCRRIIRNRFAACNGCHRYHYTLEQRLHPGRCACYFVEVRKRRCPCCCPQSTNRLRCASDDQWERVFTHYAALTGKKCGCRSWNTQRRETVACSTRRSHQWLRCNRRSCVSHQQVTYHKARRCQCRRLTKLTGKRRTCCCLTRPRTSRLCRNSAVYEKRIFYRLRNWRCVRRTSLRLLHRWRCSRRPETRIGRCNRATCIQPLHTLVDVVSRPHCRCHREVRNRRTRPCCCLKRPVRSVRCQYNCWARLTTTYSFDYRRRVCVANDTRTRWCVTCPRPQRLVDNCNRRTCRQRIRLVSHELRNCQCRRRVDYKHRVCCCPKPTVAGPFCRGNHFLVMVYTNRYLLHGRCMRKVRETRRRVYCRRGRSDVLDCNRRTCQQRIRHETVVVNRCRCRSYWRETRRTCCCRPAVRTYTRCERERYLYLYRITRTLNRSYLCVSHTSKQLVSQVRNCRTYERRGRCDQRTRHLTVYIFHQKPRNCQCQVYRRSKRRVLCRCPGPEERRSACNKTSCHLDVVKVWYTSSGKGDRFRCKRHRDVTRLRCCCHRNPTSRNFCDTRSGAIVRRETWTVFQLRTRTCVLRNSETVVRRLACPRSSCNTGRCNRKTGFKVRTCHHFSELRSNCQCRKNVTRNNIVCSCPKGHSRVICQGHRRLVTIRTVYKLSIRLNRCVRVVKRLTQFLCCSTQRWTTRKCYRNCRGVRYTHWYRLRRCRCVLRRRPQPILCCCPKSRRIKRCLGVQWLIGSVKYKLHRNRCVKKVWRKRISVSCRRRRRKTGKCRRCVRKNVTLYYHVVGCKCVLSRRSVRKRSCCCPRPKKFAHCKAGILKRVRESWKLKAGRCLRKRRVSVTRILCRASSVTAFSCDSESGRQKVVTVKYIRRGCRCVPRRRVRYILCQCEHAVIRAERCAGRLKRPVFRITYKLEDGECEPQRQLLYYEPCRCRKPLRRSKCASNGRVVITTIRRWKLSRRNRRRVCALRVTVWHSLVRCQGKSIKWSKCRRFRKYRVTIRHRPVKCKCRRRIKRKVIACDCSKRSFTRRYCDRKRGEIVFLKKYFFARRNASVCSSITRRIHRPIYCSRRRHRSLVSRKCGYYRRYGWYSKFKVTWKFRRGCSCFSRSMYLLRLCRCKRNWQRTACSICGGYFVTVRYVYRRNGPVCHLIRTESRRPVICRDSRPQILKRGCSRCWRTVSLSQCYVRSCRTRTYRKSGLQRCCIPPPSEKRYCDAKTGRWVTAITTYRLVPAEPLIRDRNGRVLVPQMKVVSGTRIRVVHVRCPRSVLKEHCNRWSGDWRKTLTTWRRVACQCKKFIRRWSGKCFCPTRRILWSRCDRRYKVRTLIYFDLKNKECKRRVERRSFLCACPKNYSFTHCDRRGHWRTCSVTYRLQFRRQRCHMDQRCRRRPHTCSAPSETSSRCSRFRRVIRRSLWHLDRRSCRCREEVRTRRADCDCDKKRSSHTVCRHGAFITTHVRYLQRAERCVRVEKYVGKPVYCDGKRRSRIVRGSCVRVSGKRRSGFQRQVIEWQENHNCICVRKNTVRWVPCVCPLIEKYKTRKSVRCVRGSVQLYTTVSYRLVRGRCERRVQIREVNIRCVGSRTPISKCIGNRQGDTYRIIRQFRKVSDGRCGCVWRQRSQRYQICQCRKSSRSTRCLRDKVWHTKQVDYYGVFGSRECRRSVKNHYNRIYCQGIFSRRTGCTLCGYTVRHYAYKYRKCGCVVQLQRVEQRKCCCPKPVTKRSCDESRNIKVAVTRSYILRNHSCHRRERIQTQQVHCGRERPQYRVLACIKGLRKIIKTIYVAYRCGCRPRTTVHRQLCSCSRAIIYRRGKCGRWYAIDILLAFKLKPTGKKIPGTDKPIMHCVRYVSDRLKRRCRCPKGYEKRLCKFHNVEEHVRVRYHLRGNSCQREREVNLRRFPCSTRRQLVRTERLPQKCTARNGYVQVLRFTYVHAQHCRCVQSTQERKRVCDCFRKYGQRTSSTRCVGHNRVVTVFTWRVPKGDGCEKRSKTRVRIVHCRGERLQRGECGQNDLRVYKLYRQRTRNCGCSWKLVRRFAVPCRCRKAFVTKSCVGNYVVTVTKRWYLVGSRLRAYCKLSRRVQKRRVPCNVGRNVRNTRCDFRGILYYITTTRRLSKCQCLKKVTRRRCRCRCKDPRSRRFCQDGRVWVTVTVKSTLKNCACFSGSAVRQDRVRCPRSHRARGSCRRGPNGDRYRKITLTSWYVSRCKCRRRRSVRRILCGCDRRRRIQRRCLAHYIRVTKVTERRFARGRCRRVLVRLQRSLVYCGYRRVRRVCNRKSGRLSIFIIRPYARRCRCYRRVTRHNRRCGCHKGSQLISVGRCNRISCRQRLLFKKQVLRSERCKWRKYHRHRVCCCKGRWVRVRCQSKTGYLVTTVTRRVLQNWHCVRRVERSSRKIRCNRKVTIRKRKLAYGILKVTRCWKVRRRCHCNTRCISVFKRYRCKKAVKRTVCHCSRGRCSWRTRIFSWRLLRGRCLREISRSRRPIICQGNTTSRTRCSRPTKNGFFYVETEVSWHQKSCRCHRRVKTRPVVCRCLKPHSRTSCHSGSIVRVIVSFRLSNGRCVKETKRSAQAIRCRSNWRLSHRTSGSPVYFKVFERFVLSDCKCVRQTKRVPCRSRCPKCTINHECVRNRYKVQSRICWRLEGCVCVRNVQTARQRVRCPGTSRTSRCRGCVHTVRTKEYSVHQCRCVERTNIARSKCCCPRPTVTMDCVRGSIRVRKVSHTLRRGGCYSQTRDKFRSVSCSRRVLREIRGRCLRGKQKYSVHYWVKIGCRCVRRVRDEFRKCTCANKVVDLYLVVDLYNKDKKGFKRKIVSFLKEFSNFIKLTAAKIYATLIAYNWNIYVDKLKHISHIPFGAKTRTDLFGALKIVDKRIQSSRAGVEKIVVIFSSGKHKNKRQTIEIAQRIKRKASVFVIACPPIPKAGQYIKLLASKPVKLFYMELNVRKNYKKYRFIATLLLERICERSCVKPVVRRSSCPRSNCRRVFTRITYHFDQRKNKCVRKSSSWWKLCCCTQRDSSYNECRRNRLFYVTVKYSFRGDACHRTVHQLDVSSRVHSACRPRISHREGKCRRDGWRRDTTEKRYVVNCLCRRRLQYQMVRCRCPKPRDSSVCQRNNRMRHCRITYQLTPSACIRRLNCRSTVIMCRPSRNFRGNCDRFSCLRDMGRVWYTVRNCKCQRQYRNWRETCCCKRQYQNVRSCDRRRNENVEIESWLELRGTSCRRVSRRIVRPVLCPNRRVEYSQCVPGRDGYYRNRLVYTWRKRDCGCIRSLQPHLELCRCRRGHTVRRCQSGSWVLIRHSLLKSGNRCVPRVNVISRERVTCSSDRQSRTGRCRHARGNRWYARVVQTWQRRVGCACRLVRKVVMKLCGCPKPIRRLSCRGNSRRVTTVYAYMLQGDRCHLYKTTSYIVIGCGKARTRVSKCRGKTQAVVVTLSRPRNCKCKSMVYRSLVPCKSKCRDLLPTKICRKWGSARKINLCDRYPYFAKSLCAKTCHRCYGCKKTKIVYSGKFCLSKQFGFPRTFLLSRNSSFDRCVRSCRGNHKCRAFEYDNSTRRCRLLRVSRGDFLMRMPWLRLRKTPGCVLFERVCPTKCNFRRIIKNYKCRCVKFGRRKRLCYRSAAVATWKRDRSGRCKRHVHKLRIPCRRCEDRSAWCRKSKAKCSKHLVRSFCNYTCGVCKQKPRYYHRRGHCSKHGWLRDTGAKQFYDKKLNLWRVRISVSRRRCVRCPVGSYQLVGSCQNGKRRVKRVIARYIRRKCRITVQSKLFSCLGCNLATNRVVSNCVRLGHRWVRKVVTQYTIRLAGRCVVRQSFTSFSCSPRCPRTRVSRSPCKCGRRIRCVHYYVTYPGSKVCVPKKSTTSERCDSAKQCRDIFFPADCFIVKKNRMCRSMKIWCRRTCGYCK